MALETCTILLAAVFSSSPSAVVCQPVHTLVTSERYCMDITINIPVKRIAK
jgi:hypothetical protein